MGKKLASRSPEGQDNPKPKRQQTGNEAAGLDSGAEAELKSNLQSLENHLLKYEEAKKELLPVLCDLLEGKTENWSERTRLGKVWQWRTVERIQKLITTECFPGEDEKS